MACDTERRSAQLRAMSKSAPLIILANAPDSRAPAAMIARRLMNLGYAVDQRSIPDALDDDLGGAKRLLLIWSRGAAADSADITRHASKLSVVQLASSPSPPKLRDLTVRLPRGGDEGAWRKLAEGKAAAQAPRAAGARASTKAAPTPQRRPERKGKSWGGVVAGVIALLGLATAVAYFAMSGDGAELLSRLQR